MTRRAADCADAAFERGNAFLQRCNRWIGQAGINITDFLKIKQSGRVVGIAKDVGCCLINRHLPRTGCGIRAGARVDLQRIKTITWTVRHRLLLCFIGSLATGLFHLEQPNVNF